MANFVNEGPDTSFQCSWMLRSQRGEDRVVARSRKADEVGSGLEMMGRDQEQVGLGVGVHEGSLMLRRVVACSL